MAKNDIKDLILGKARALVEENGSFTIKELTEATHVNIAAVNYHFGSKENLNRVIIQDVIADFKRVLSLYIFRLKKGVPINTFIPELVNVLFDFTTKNAGLIKYLFITMESQQFTADEMMSAFFSDNEFTATVYEALGRLINSDNPKEIAARYTVFFSAAIAPMVFQITQGLKGSKEAFNDQEFKEYYLEQMIRILS